MSIGCDSRRRASERKITAGNPFDYQSSHDSAKERESDCAGSAFQHASNGLPNTQRYPDRRRCRPVIARLHDIYTVIMVAGGQRELAGVIYDSARCVRSCSPYDLIGFNYSSLKVTPASCCPCAGWVTIIQPPTADFSYPRSALIAQPCVYDFSAPILHETRVDVTPPAAKIRIASVLDNDANPPRWQPVIVRVSEAVTHKQRS